MIKLSDILSEIKIIPKLFKINPDKNINWKIEINSQENLFQVLTILKQLEYKFPDRENIMSIINDDDYNSIKKFPVIIYHNARDGDNLWYRSIGGGDDPGEYSFPYNSWKKIN